MTTHIFTEAIDLSEATLDIDNRVLRGAVLIFAGESANKRHYPADVLRNSLGVFEGVKSFSDHPTRSDQKERSERSIRDITGWYENVRFENDRLVADRHFVPTQAGNDAWALAEMIASGKAPKNLAGLSINAVGTAKKRDDGGMVVESITFAHSVDDVTTPAAGGSYIESQGGDTLLAAVLQEMTFDEWYQTRPEYTERVKKEMKSVRQDTALTEAQALAERVQTELNTAQETLRQTEAQRVADVEQIEALRREVAFEKMARKVSFPKEWEISLREQLLALPMTEWTAIIDSEKQKARAAGHRATVQGAGQQIHTPLAAHSPPRDPVTELRERLANAKDLDEFNRIMAALQEQYT
jgi:hypothetical protein